LTYMSIAGTLSALEAEGKLMRYIPASTRRRPRVGSILLSKRIRIAPTQILPSIS